MVVCFNSHWLQCICWVKFQFVLNFNLHLLSLKKNIWFSLKATQMSSLDSSESYWGIAVVPTVPVYLTQWTGHVQVKLSALLLFLFRLVLFLSPASLIRVCCHAETHRFLYSHKEVKAWNIKREWKKRGAYINVLLSAVIRYTFFVWLINWSN